MHGEGSCAERGVRFAVSETIFIHTVWRAVAIKLQLITPSWLMESCNIITLSGAYNIVQYYYFMLDFKQSTCQLAKRPRWAFIKVRVFAHPFQEHAIVD